MKSYICSECAKENGGTWPEGHVATFHEDECWYCHKQKGVSHFSDWDWPQTSVFDSMAGPREF